MPLDIQPSLGVIRDLFGKMNACATALGETLDFIKSNKLYLQFGNDVEFWNQFLDHIGMTVSEAQKYVDLYCAIGNERVIISPSRLKKSLKYSKISKTDIHDWIHVAENAPNKDFTNEIDKIKGKKDYLECTHEETEKMLHCKVCGRWIKEDSWEENKHQEITGHSVV